ncbi:TPA: hypothetical protein ACYFH0_005554 [Klebsiella pneumoniae]|jgi:hypothetical protein|uniref:Uncharacterized protein n=2 Tax=Klebsiella pneumoniae TaxID=573 RepID=A0AAW9V017_KLEPN|nr:MULTISPECIES: hypothetical protein [Klebsiella]DAU60711.1 MAG TPA: hypothetical protein [Caudoviricetes sp.]HAJ3307199.1 hypothetical protein [Escherichia coli]HBW8929713.1 hypothetical protein [Klebsiella pneumoniae subsp. pneumoniae 1158]HBZ8108676.1 hypothetical protein [Klebsiella variicola subsp. variicola]HCD5782613.1 hypothetical protein [Klebsiella aerogenes]HCI4621233.1 hypothetical protein [Klebsiella quasipneumoniae subsp. similipneumoniae]HCI6019855.1 hypothetical protein [Kle
MHNALNASRSIQTIRDCTSVIETHVLAKHKIEVRKLNNDAVELKDTRFIVTFKDDVEMARASVKPLAEAIFLNGRVRFVVKPDKQYPELLRDLKEFSEVIEHSIRRFVLGHGSIDSHVKADRSATKWLLH